MSKNYKGNSRHPQYYWDLDNWNPNKHQVERIIQEYASDNFNECNVFRITSILCYLVYAIMLINRWFNRNLTIKL